MLTGLIVLALQDPLEILRRADGQAAMRELVGRGDEVRSALQSALPALEEPARSRAEMVLALLDWQPRWPTFDVETPGGRLADVVIALRAAGVPISIDFADPDLPVASISSLVFQNSGAAEIAEEISRAAQAGVSFCGGVSDLNSSVLGRTFLLGPYGVQVYSVAHERERDEGPTCVVLDPALLLGAPQFWFFSKCVG